MPSGAAVEFDLITEFASVGVTRVEIKAQYDGPFFPKVTSGLLTLDDVDQGERFLVTGDTWTIDDGASGTHLAFIRKVSLGSQFAGGFALFPE